MDQVGPAGLRIQRSVCLDQNLPESGEHRLLGAELTDPKRLLEGDGDRMRRIKLSRRADIPEPALKPFVKEAAKLKQALGDPTQRTKEPPLPKTSGGLGLTHRGPA
jgi:hypothetical protein